MHEITISQDRLLKAIIHLQDSMERSPSQKELAEELGISVPSVWSGLNRLEYWGYISREYAKKRSIKVLV